MSKQQKDKLRKQRSEKLRAIVSSEGRRYEKIQKDFSLTRDTAREYVLSVRQKGGGGGERRRRRERTFTAVNGLAPGGGDLSRRPRFVGSDHGV